MPHYPVVVIGGGPTGLTIANLLSQYGTRALLVERNATTVQEPRAVSIDDESLRTMQAAGVVDKVMEAVEAGYGSEYYTPGGKLFLKVSPVGQPFGYPRRNAFRQPRLEKQLYESLCASKSVDTLFGWTLVGFEQDDDGVTVRLKCADDSERLVRCDYLVGADGASSAVRLTLGLGLEGETFQEKWLIVDLEESPASSRETIVFCDHRRPCIALPGPNRTRRYEFKLMPGENPDRMTDDAIVADLLRMQGADLASKVRRKVVYTFHARVAERWSQGRVYLAGDACHLTPPFAGQGMNSGIRDAHNLAWKLAWVCARRLPASLLDSYEPERKGHVREMIDLALRMGRIMGPRSALHSFATQTIFRILGLWPPARDYFGQMKFKPKPRFMRGFILADGDKGRQTAVGRLLPQPIVTLPSNERILLDHLLGHSFALISVTEDVAGLAAAAREISAAGLPVTAVAIGASRIGDDSVILAHDSEGAILSAAHGLMNRVMIVRPDRYVFATFTLGEEADFIKKLAAITAHGADKMTA